MDLHSVETYLCPTQFREIETWQNGTAWVAGGTWMFSEPQPQVTTLIDLTRLGWSELEASSDGLAIGATCTLNNILQYAYPPEWTGVKALQRATQELASFKVQNVATVGGNLCLAIPAGTFAPAMLLLQATYEILSLNGSSFWVPAAEFQTGAKQTILQPGDVLRKIWIAQDSLTWQVSYQRICLAAAGLALAIVTTAYQPQTSHVRVAIGAAIPAARLLEFNHVPDVSEMTKALDRQVPSNQFLEDELASAAYRRHVTQVLMRRSLQEATTTN